jgi:predicted HAD superfamily phosphohydrolase YqeG
MGTEKMTIPSRRPVSAVLFDLDNTLADRDRAYLA